jgi:SAM-dependent methyltransferase
MPAPGTPDDETALFRTSWSLYDALSAKNYMFHHEIYALVADMLGRRHAAGAYTLLDLGCGNTRFLAPCLKAAPPSRYEGVDLSATALDEARGYLRGLPDVALHCQDMLLAVREASAAFDVIFTGFAVHHLESEQKQQLFHECAAKLVPGGCFIMVDVAREEGQTREQYLEGYLDTMRTRWTAICSEDIDAACAHVASFDFPETVSSLTRMADTASFRETRLVERFEQHHVMLFTR